MSFVDKILKTSTVPIYYLSSRDGNGKDCYYIIICTKQKLDAMRSASGIVQPQDYGHVIDYGFGKRPPEAVVTMLKRDYQFDIDAA